MTVKALIELDIQTPGIGPLYYTLGPSGFFGWTSIPQDALGYDKLIEAQAFMSENYLDGVATAREHKFMELTGS